MKTKTTLGLAKFWIVLMALLFLVTAADLGVGRRQRRGLQTESRPGWQGIQPEPV